MATAANSSETESEADEIIRWRSQELRRAGYEERAALLIALHTEVDLHLATRLLAEGCPPKVAVRILL
jgi:hypothetical protein